MPRISRIHTEKSIKNPCFSVSVRVIRVQKVLVTAIPNEPKKLNFRCRKVGMLPAKADPEKQQEFLEQEIQPRLEEAQAGKRVVLFVDAAHFVLSAFLGFLWSATRIFIRAPSGRQRFNVLGALNAITHEMTTITNDAYITAESVCALLEKIANLYIGIPITIFFNSLNNRNL